jgi:hypothetical protein
MADRPIQVFKGYIRKDGTNSPAPSVPNPDDPQGPQPGTGQPRHNALEGLQGGDPSKDEFYHLSEEEALAVNAPDEAPGFIKKGKEWININEILAEEALSDWTSATPPLASWSNIAFGNGVFVSVSTGPNSTAVMTSPDGITWTLRTASSTGQRRAVTFGNGLFVAVNYQYASGSTAVMTSPDGITWTDRNNGSGTSSQSGVWTDITFGNGLFVAVAEVNDKIMYSSDGINWTRISPFGFTHKKVNFGDGVFLILGGGSFGAPERLIRSTDGINWSEITLPSQNRWTDIAFGNGLFVAVAEGALNQIMISEDLGLTWTTYPSPQLNNWLNIIFASGYFVATSRTGTNRVMYSKNGISWTLQTSPQQNDWQNIAFGNGKFVSVSPNGTNRVMYSSIINNGFIKEAPNNGKQYGRQNLAWTEILSGSRNVEGGTWDSIYLASQNLNGGAL